MNSSSTQCIVGYLASMLRQDPYRVCHVHSRMCYAHCEHSCTRCARGRICRVRSLGLCARVVPCRVRRPALWVVTKKHHVTTTLLETLSRHKVLCRDRNVPPLGKLCHDTRRPSLRSKPGPIPNSIATLNFF